MNKTAEIKLPGREPESVVAGTYEMEVTAS